MYKVFNILIFIMICSVTAFGAVNYQNILLVKDWESGSNNSALEKMYNAFYTEMSGYSAFKVFESDYFSNLTQTKLPLSFDIEIDPLRLYELNTSKRMDAVVFFTPAAESLQITIKAFPTGSLIDKVKLDLTLADNMDLANMIKINMNKTMQKLLNTVTTEGYPFENNEYGIIAISSNVFNNHFKNTIENLIKYYNTTVDPQKKCPIKIKIINNSITCDSASYITTVLNAKAALRFVDENAGDNKLTLVFPPNMMIKPYIDMEMPFFPQLNKLVCFPLTNDNLLLSNLEEILFNNEINNKNLADVPVMVYKLLNLHKAWKNSENPVPVDLDMLNNYYILIYNNLPDQSIEKAWLGLNNAGFYRQSNQWVLADPILSKSLITFKAQNDTNGLVLGLLESARVAGLKKQWSDAELYYNSALQLRTIRRDSISVAKIHYNLGLIAEITGNIPAAINNYENSAYIYKNTTDGYKAMQIYNKLGLLLGEEKQNEKSMDYFELYLAKANELHSEPDIANGNYKVGISRMLKSDYKGASKNFVVARSFYDILGDEKKLSAINLQLGIIALKLGKNQEALNFLTIANTQAAQNNDDLVLAQTYMYLGDIDTNNKQWMKAQSNYQNAFDTALKTQSNEVIAKIIYSRGIAHLKEGQTLMGYEELKKSIEMSNGEVHGGKDRSNAFLNKIELALKNNKN